MTMHNLFKFECSSDTYVQCMELSLFGSNKPWPLQVKAGDYLLLNHYDASALFGVWQATCDGAQNIVLRAWNKRFPYQVRIKLVTPKPVQVPPALIEQYKVDLSLGEANHIEDAETASALLAACGIGG
jgi:hypothetical protein